MSPTNPDLIAYFSNGNICVHDVTTNSDAKLTDLTDDDGKFVKFRFSRMVKKFSQKMLIWKSFGKRFEFPSFHKRFRLQGYLGVYV